MEVNKRNEKSIITSSEKHYVTAYVDTDDISGYCAYKCVLADNNDVKKYREITEDEHKAYLSKQLNNKKEENKKKQ